MFQNNEILTQFIQPSSNINKIIKMDPRPYNYEFRKPRLNNPTYQSYNAYESLYHMGKVQPPYSNSFLKDQYAYKMDLYSPNYSQIYSGKNQKKDSSSPIPATQQLQKRYEDIGIGTQGRSARVSSNYSERSKSSASSNNLPQQRSSILSNYGSNSLQKNITEPKREAITLNLRNATSQVYKKQQKPFDIINLYSRGNEPLRKFPKLTMQNLMYQKGMQPVRTQ